MMESKSRQTLDDRILGIAQPTKNLINFKPMDLQLTQTSQIPKTIVRRARLAAILMPFVLVPSVPAQDLPDGPGKELLMNVCTTCHTLNRVTERKETKDGWNDLVDKMAAKGARASDEEFDTIVNYLTKNFGKE
jgi:cytochrome c5